MQELAILTCSYVSHIVPAMFGAITPYWATISLFLVLVATLTYTIREVLTQYREDD